MDIDKFTSAVTEALANLLKEKRVAADLTKTRLAERAGLAFQTIAFIEKAERRPTVETVTRLAVALDSSASELISEAEKRARKQI